MVAALNIRCCLGRGCEEQRHIQATHVGIGKLGVNVDQRALVRTCIVREMTTLGGRAGQAAHAEDGSVGMACAAAAAAAAAAAVVVVVAVVVELVLAGNAVAVGAAVGATVAAVEDAFVSSAGGMDLAVEVVVEELWGEMWQEMCCWKRAARRMSAALQAEEYQSLY